MCKIIAFTDTKKINLKSCVNEIGNTLLKTEVDGFGYAVKGKSGVFGEKAIVKHFKSRLGSKPIMLPIVKQRYMSFGTPDELTGPGIFHGRTSTNSDGLINTHPMQRPDDKGLWHLIHNGVVDDYGPKYSKLTDNDSEDVLHRLMVGIEHNAGGLTDNPMLEIEQTLEGYYAFACIDSDGLLHVAKDSYADLYMAWSDKLNTFIFATTEGLINKLNKMLSAEFGPIDEVEDDVYMVFNGNELIYHQTIEPRGYTVTQASKAGASLGRELSPAATGDYSGNGFNRIGLAHGGEVIVRSPEHHRPKIDSKSEADWQNESNAFDAALDTIVVDSERLDDEEMEYYAYRREIDNMGDGYTIMDEHDIYISITEFKKLDHISQEMCTIIRPDNTVVLFDDVKGYKHRA